MSHVQVGQCPQCGAPIYSPGAWMSTMPPPTYRTCGCGTQGKTFTASSTAPMTDDEHIRTVIREEMRTMRDELFREFEIYLTQRLRGAL